MKLLDVLNEKREAVMVRDRASPKEVTILTDPSGAEFVGFMNRTQYARGLIMQERPHPTGKKHYVIWSGYEAVHLSMVNSIRRDFDWEFDGQLEFEWANQSKNVEWDRLGPFVWTGPQSFLQSPLAQLIGRTGKLRDL